MITFYNGDGRTFVIDESPRIIIEPQRPERHVIAIDPIRFSSVIREYRIAWDMFRVPRLGRHGRRQTSRERRAVRTAAIQRRRKGALS